MEQSCLRHHSCYSELGHSLSSGTRRSLTRGGRKLLLRIVLKGAAASLLLPMPRHPSWRFYFLTHLQVKERADERTRTADLLITSDRSRVAEGCTELQIPHS